MIRMTTGIDSPLLSRHHLCQSTIVKMLGATEEPQTRYPLRGPCMHSAIMGRRGVLEPMSEEALLAQIFTFQMSPDKGACRRTERAGQC